MKSKSAAQLDREIREALSRQQQHAARKADYVYRNADDSVRIRVFQREVSTDDGRLFRGRRAWDFDVFRRDGSMENYSAEGATEPLRTKAEAIAVARRQHGPLRSISVGERVTEGW